MVQAMSYRQYTKWVAFYTVKAKLEQDAIDKAKFRRG